MEKMRVFSCFSGIGGFELGILNAVKPTNTEIEFIGFSEIDQFAISVYSRHFPEVRNHGDIRKIKENELPDFNCLVGGFCCQSHSIIGQRKGLEDPKGQVKLFRTTAKNNKYRFIFEMLLTYGLRRGEVLALEWGDVDFDRGIIRINKQYTYVGNELQVVPPKTKNSKRELPIMPHIEALLNEMRPRNLVNCPVSLNNGELVKPNNLQWEFERITAESELPTVTLHSLRHFAATTLGEAGVTIKDAQMILGHASPYTTMNNYQHSTNESKKEALEKYIKKMSF